LSAVRLLPAPYAVAIRLRDEGQHDHVIALALEIDEDQVPTLLQIADSKLSNVIGLDPGASSRTDGTGRPHAIPARKKRDEGGSS
jgi:hypothetical protein